MCNKRTNPKRKKINLLGIYISSTYMLITLLLKWYTYGIFKQSLEDQNIAYAEIQTKPTPLNSILWNANVETENSYLIGSYSLFDKDKDVNFSEHKKNYHLLEGLENNPTIDRLKKLTQGWYTVQKLEDKLFVNDLRFGLMSVNDNSDEFVFRYELTPTENGALIAEQTDPNPKDAGPMLRELWERVLGVEKEKTYKHRVGYINTSNTLNFDDFSLCGEKMYGWYHSAAPKIYKNNKNSFRTHILTNFKNKNYPDSGYLNLRFHIDCKGNVGNMIVNELDENLEKTDYTDELVDQLISLTQRKENWDTFADKDINYYMYLNFKIKNGEITEILP